MNPNSADSKRTIDVLRRMSTHQKFLWETCEARLVLSAQLLGELVDPNQLQMHGELLPAISNNDIGSGISVEPHTAKAHQVTGWNAMQQEFGLKGDGQTIAVIDSGIAFDHVALGKGYGAGYRVVGGWDFAENDNRPYDDGPSGFHGTHVAGIIGADSKTNSGVAPEVDLVALRVFNDSGQGQIEWVEQALTWIHNNRNSFENPITTVNLSLGTAWNADTIPNWGTLENELKQLYDDGIVVVASAGNSFKQYNAPGLSYPAVSSYVLPVASVDDDGTLSDFSQRSSRVLAAPGRNIVSSVPDHVLGRDGKIDDYSTATGTSMAAPYVAGATALVREAMQMVGMQDITPAKIIDWLHDTADSVYDTITKASYDRLDLQNAIDSLIPDDNVGNQSSDAQSINLTQKSISGWMNSVDDTDVYRFTANAAGQLSLDADSKWVESLHWELHSNGSTVASSGLDLRSLQLNANQSYELHVTSDDEIGTFQLNLNFQAAPDSSQNPSNGGGGSSGGSTTTPVALGNVDFLSRDVSAGTTYQAVALHDGTFTVQWTNADSATGSLVLRDGSGVAHTDSQWEDGRLRIDVTAKAGQRFEFQVPGSRSDMGRLTLVDLLQSQGTDIVVRDTPQGDTIDLNLSNGIGIKLGDVQYSFNSSQYKTLTFEGAINNDQLSVVGSSLVDKVDMKPGLFTLENSQLEVTARGIELVNFDSGVGQSDRVYMYDSDGDDTLTSRPGSAELVGSGYRFQVDHVDRIFVHATGQGQDFAYMYDSAGNDVLSVRPQFTSLWGDGFFNSVRGFERVFVYATSGGYDKADLYDSSGNDRFSTSGETASIVGDGFFSFTRFFEQVQAHATAGGHDTASLYGSNSQTQWQRGSDFISYRESSYDRNAQGFEKTETFVSGLAQSISSLSSYAESSSLIVSAYSLPDEQSQPEQSDSSTNDSEWTNDSQGADALSSVGPVIQSDTTEDETSVDWIPMSEQARGRHAAQIDDPWGALQERGVSKLHTRQMLVQDDDADRTAELLSELLDSAEEVKEQLAMESLQWHRNPSAERALLDELFARFGKSDA